MAAKSGTYVKYHREERIEIGKFALNNGVASAVRHFVTKYPRLCRSSCRNLKDKYKESLRAEKRILNNQSSGTENPARMYQQKRFVRKAHKGSYMKFSDADRDIIAKAVIELGAPAALQKYKPFFPRLRESTCRYLRDRYIKSLGLSPKDIKSRNFLSKFSSRVSFSSKSGLNNQDVDSREIFDSQTEGEDIPSKNSLSPASASYTVFSGRDQLTTNDINNSAGNYENFGQRNLRNEALEGETLSQVPDQQSGSRGHMSKLLPVEGIDPDKRRLTKTAIGMTKGRYNKFCREEREEIGRYAYMYGATKAMRHLRDKYPQLRESTCRHLRDKYMSSLKEEQKEHLHPGNNRELTDELGDVDAPGSNSYISSEGIGEGEHDEDEGSNGALSYSSFDSNSDYLQKEDTPTVIPGDLHLQTTADFGILENNGNLEDRGFLSGNTKKRGQYNKYDEDDRCEIGMFAAENGIVATLRHFKDRFPNLNESTCRNFRDKYNISVGIEVSNDVSEFDPVSFVDVYSNVKLSDNSEGIVTKAINSGDSGSPKPALSQGGKRGGFVSHSEVFQTNQKEGVNVTHSGVMTTSDNSERMKLLPMPCASPEGGPIVVPPSSNFSRSASFDSMDMMPDGNTSRDSYQDYGDVKRSSSSSQKSKVKRGSYCKFNEEAKIEIGKFASRYGVSRTYMHFQPKYPRLKESTCRYFKELYEKELKWKDTQDTSFSNRSGPNIIIRPSSHFERMRKPLILKTARIPGAPTDRFPAPATVVSQRQVTFNSETTNQSVAIPRSEARGNFSFVDPSTNLHISNVESLSSDQLQSIKPVRIKIEDEDDEMLQSSASSQSSKIGGTPHQAQMGAFQNSPVPHNVRTSDSDMSSRHTQNVGRPVGGSPSVPCEKDDPSTDYMDVNRDSEMTARSEGQKRRGQYMAYNHEDRVEIGRFATENGPSPALKHFRGKYPRISESTVRYFRHKYLSQQKSRAEIVSGDAESGRRLSGTTDRLINIDEAEAIIVRFLKLLQEEGGSIGISVALSISRGIIEARNKSLLTEYGGSFTLTKGWMKSVLARHSLNSDVSY